MASLDKWLSHAAGWATMVECLLDGPHTVFELYDETGMHMNTIRKFLRVLYRRKRIYVAAWEKDNQGRHTIAAYTFGSKPDAKRPPRLTPTQRSANLRKRRAVQRMSITASCPAP